MPYPTPILCTICTAILIGLTPTTASAQSWARINAFGYGSAGFVLGWVLALERDCTDEGLGCLAGSVLLAPAAGATGALVGAEAGAAIGRRADRAIERREAPSHAVLGGVATGTVLAGATVGLSVAGALVEASGNDTILGSPARTAITLSAVGAGAGILYLASRWGELTVGSLEIAPLYLPGGTPGVVTRIRF